MQTLAGQELLPIRLTIPLELEPLQIHAVAADGEELDDVQAFLKLDLKPTALLPAVRVLERRIEEIVRPASCDGSILLSP